MTGIAPKRLYTQVATGQSFAGLTSAFNPSVIQVNCMSGFGSTKSFTKLDEVGSALLLFQ